MRKAGYYSVALLLTASAVHLCCNTREDAQAKKSANIHTIKLVLEDSIPLYNDSLSFSFVNIDKINADTLLAFQYPILNLSLLDKKGIFKKEISRRGTLKEQFISAFINTSFGADGNLYVLEEGNAPRLTVFDKNLNYLRSIPLTDKIGNHYIPTLKSSFYLEFPDQKVDSFLLHVSIGSILFHPTSKKLYLEDSSIAIITIKNGQVSGVHFKVPLQEVETIKTGLAADKKTWDSPTPIFKESDGKFYVKYEFDDLIYVFNNSWNLVNKYAINCPYDFSGYSTPFKAIKDVNESVASDFKFRYLNQYCYSMDVSGQKAFVLYYKPGATRKIPKNTTEERKYNPVSVLHVLDMAANREYNCELPSFVSPYSPIVVKGENEIFLLGNNKLKEDISIYKFRISYDQ